MFLATETAARQNAAVPEKDRESIGAAETGC